MSEYVIEAGAWYTGLSAEQLAACARRTDKPFTIESLADRHRLGRRYVVDASELGEAFQRAYMAFAVDSYEAELSIPGPDSVSLEWQRSIERDR